MSVCFRCSTDHTELINLGSDSCYVKLIPQSNTPGPNYTVEHD